MTKIPLCFFCGGNARYDVVIAGPREMKDYSDEGMICVNCQGARAADEILVFEATQSDPGCGNPKLTSHGEGMWFTGRWVNIETSVAINWFPVQQREYILEHKFAVINTTTYAQVKLDQFTKDALQ